TIAFAGFTVDWTTNETASDFFNITNSGDFGDVSLMVLQQTGNPTNGTMLEIINTDANVDHMVVGGTDFVITAAGNVGIGTSAPTAGLVVMNDDSIEINFSTSPDLLFTDSSAGDDDWNIEVSADDMTMWQRVGDAVWTERMTLKGSGNVGIGTTAASGILDVEGGDVFIGTATLTNASGNDDVSIEGNLEVDGTIYGDGSGITGVTAGSVVYNNIGDAAAESTIAFAGFTVDWTTNETASDFFNITNSGDFGDVSLMVLQQTGNPTNGTMLEIINTDTNVDSLLVNTTDFVVIGGGNVGVGTSGPAYDLDVNGTVNVATSIEIPSGTGPTVDAEGEIAIDTTDDQFVYFGGAKRVLSFKQMKAFTLENPADADNFILWKTLDPITITDIECIVDPADAAESVVIDVQERDSTADNPATVDATITCDNDGAADDGTLTNGAIDANDWISLDIGAVTGTVTQVSVTIYYTLDAE
ncbi:MAG: hypothetical protein KC733_09445, partial [Candidatus Omnitrophica bacterium]|nr:hypothetical protein [Candidatus Omnitrophota bacterium]